MKIAQMIPTSADNSIFILDFEDDGILTFRVSNNPEHLQKEKVVIDKEKVYTNLFFFSCWLFTTVFR